MANLLVTTDNIDERARLEEEFSCLNSYYEVGKGNNGTLQAIFRSISFQYFQNNPPLVVQKIINYAEKSINHICSLTLLRQIISILKREQNHLAIYQQYFLDINQQIGDSNLQKQDIGLSNQYNSAEQNDKLFDLASKGELRFTRHLQHTDFKEEFETSIKIRQPFAISEKTQIPTATELNPQQKNTGQKIDKTNQLSHIFDQAQAYYGKQWWKPEKQNDSSKQISKFQCKNDNAFLQKSFKRLVMEELKYDLNREMFLGKQVNKNEQIQGFKFKKLMKDRLLSAKLKKRSKK